MIVCMQDNESPQRNQVRRVVINYELSTELFSERKRVVNGLPDDATFIRAYPMEARETFELVFQSSKFEPVPQGEEIPEYDVVFEKIPEYHTKPQ